MLVESREPILNLRSAQICTPLARPSRRVLGAASAYYSLNGSGAGLPESSNFSLTWADVFVRSVVLCVASSVQKNK